MWSLSAESSGFKTCVCNRKIASPLHQIFFCAIMISAIPLVCPTLKPPFPQLHFSENIVNNVFLLLFVSFVSELLHVMWNSSKACNESQNQAAIVMAFRCCCSIPLVSLSLSLKTSFHQNILQFYLTTIWLYFVLNIIECVKNCLLRHGMYSWLTSPHWGFSVPMKQTTEINFTG